MFDSPVFIYDRKIAFNKRLFYPNSLFYDIGIESLYTEHGFIVPVNVDSINVIDLLEDPTVKLYSNSKAFQITKNAVVYEWIFDSSLDGRGINKKRVLIGNGTRLARACTDTPIYRSAITCMGSSSIEEAVDNYMKITMLQNSKYVIMNIDDIASKLKELYPEKEEVIKFVD